MWYHIETDSLEEREINMQTNNETKGTVKTSDEHVYEELARMHYNTMLDEEGLAKRLKVSTRTLRRMVQRYELPAGTPLGRKSIWVVGQVLDFLKERMQRKIEVAHKQYAKLEKAMV